MSNAERRRRYRIRHPERARASVRAWFKKNPEYKVWRRMKDRCHNPKHERYPQYGGRGITVCTRWRSSFTAFLLDMGRQPSKKHSLERKNNDKRYSPSNCLWATNHVQARNTQRTHFIRFKGRRQCLQDWADELGVTREVIYNRLKRNLPIDQVPS